MTFNHKNRGFRRERKNIMNRQVIYADNAATTKMSSIAVQAMLPYFNKIYANPSSIHLAGQQAAASLFQARKQIADMLNCLPKEIFFTSGGSEADNQALISAAALGKRNCKKHIISTAIEHHAVLHTLDSLKEEGFDITLLKPKSNGIINPIQVREAIRSDTCLVSVMYANNEIGSVQPIKEIGNICRNKNIIFHTDAVQAAGHIPIDIKLDNIDMLSLSAHKFHGPKGIGVLFAKDSINLTSIIYGGSQERGKRAGTENLPAIIGMTAALKEAQQKMYSNISYISNLRNRLIAGLGKIEGAKLNSGYQNSLPGIVNYSFANINGEALLSYLSNEGICASSGSACSSGSLTPSHVLLACGITPKLAQSSLRLSLSEYNTIDEINIIIQKITEAVNHLRR